MLSLPKDAHDMVSQLSLPGYVSTETGLIKIESKENLAKRGIRSPDEAEALTMSEACHVLDAEGEWMRRMVGRVESSHVVTY